MLETSLQEKAVLCKHHLAFDFCSYVALCESLGCEQVNR